MMLVYECPRCKSVRPTTGETRTGWYWVGAGWKHKCTAGGVDGDLVVAEDDQGGVEALALRIIDIEAELQRLREMVEFLEAPVVDVPRTAAKGKKKTAKRKRAAKRKADEWESQRSNAGGDDTGSAGATLPPSSESAPSAETPSRSGPTSLAELASRVKLPDHIQKQLDEQRKAGIPGPAIAVKEVQSKPPRSQHDN